MVTLDPWGSFDGGHQSRGGALGNLDVSSVFDDTSVVSLVAGSGDGSVSVVSLKFSLVGFVPVEGTGHGSTVASSRANVVAINELLLGEGVEGTGLDEICTFDTPRRGEGPA